jgi:hypothetical protein
LLYKAFSPLSFPTRIDQYRPFLTAPLKIVRKPPVSRDGIIEALRAGGLTRDTYSCIVATDEHFPLVAKSEA